MLRDIKKYDEKQEKSIIYEIWFSMIKLKYEERVKLLYKYGSSKNIYILKCLDNYFGNIPDDSIYNLEFAKKLYNECLQRDIICISIHSKKYPKKLLEIYDPPYILYVKGNISILTKKYIAVIGARNCTWYGSKIAKDITKKIIQKGYGIISRVGTSG